jgi:hypothetical protein
MKMNQHYQLWQDPPFFGWSLWCLIKISYKTYTVKDNPLRPISVAEKNQPVSSSINMVVVYAGFKWFYLYPNDSS